MKTLTAFGRVIVRELILALEHVPAKHAAGAVEVAAATVAEYWSTSVEAVLDVLERVRGGGTLDERIGACAARRPASGSIVHQPAPPVADQLCPIGPLNYRASAGERQKTFLISGAETVRGAVAMH